MIEAERSFLYFPYMLSVVMVRVHELHVSFERTILTSAKGLHHSKIALKRGPVLMIHTSSPDSSERQSLCTSKASSIHP
jgi:hypothetical protein